MLTESLFFAFLWLPLLTRSGKIVKDDNAKSETEVKKDTAEVKTVPNEAPQANGNESRA